MKIKVGDEFGWITLAGERHYGKVGRPIVWVQQQLGHQNIAITVDLYGQWMKTEQAGAADSLERLVSGS